MLHDSENGTFNITYSVRRKIIAIEYIAIKFSYQDK